MIIKFKIRDILYSIFCILLFDSFSEASLYYNDYFDNTRYKENYNVTSNLGGNFFAVSTVKLIGTIKDDPPIPFGIDAGYSMAVSMYHDLVNDNWVLYNFGGYGYKDGEFSHPHGIVANSYGDIYVSDTGNNRIVKLKCNLSDMSFVKNFGNGILSDPNQISLDKQGNVYVCDTGNNRICVFDKDGNFIKSFGTTGYGNGQFQNPMGVSVSIADSSGVFYIYVADTGNGRIQKFDSSGNFIKEFRRSDEQPISAGYFSIDTDLFGNVYAVDSVNNLVYKLDKDLNYVMSTSGKPDNQFYGLHGISCDKSYDNNGVWFSEGRAFTIENTRAQYFDIGMDVVNAGVSTTLFYPKATQNNTVEIRYRLTEYGEVTINVKDGTGSSTIRSLVVNNLENIGWNSHSWDGKDNNGKVVSEGKYSFEIIAHDLYNEGRGNKQVIKYVIDIEVVLPPIVSITSISPSVVIRGMQPKIGYIVSKGYTLEKQVKVTMKTYKSTEVFDETTLVRTIITDKINDKNIVNYETWDMKDNTGVGEALDGIYTVVITSEDIAGISEPTRSPPITVDRTPSYITKVYFSPYTFTGTTTLNYTISEQAEVKLEIINSRGISLYTESVIKPPGEQTYIWDGKIGGNSVSDGAYTFKITTKDEVGNIEKESKSCIKNRIPTAITFPEKDNDEVVDTVIIKGTGLDPNIDNNNRVDNFNTYKLYFRAGNNTYITEVELKNLDLNIWKPIPVPAINQLATDVNYPNSNVSYRSVIETTVGIWDTFKPESSDGVYTILLISEDELGSVEAATRVVKINNTTGVATIPRIRIDSVAESFVVSENTYLPITYSLFNKNADISLEVYQKIDGVGKIVRYKEYKKEYGNIGQHIIMWDGKDGLGNLVDSGKYVIKLIAKGIDGIGIDSASKDVVITRQEPELAITLTAVPLVFIPDGIQNTTITYTLSKQAKISLGVYQDVTSTTVLKTFLSDETKLAGKYSINWDGRDLPTGTYIIKLIASATDVNDPTYNNPKIEITPIATTMQVGRATANISTPVEGSIEKGKANYTFKATGSGKYYPIQNFKSEVKANGTHTYYPPQIFTVTVRATGLSSYDTTHTVSATKKGEGTDPESGIRVDSPKPNFSQYVRVTWNNATNASSAIYSEGSQLKWYGEGSGSEDLWFWAKTIWHPGPPTPWEYLWETDTDLGVVAWGGRYWFGIWWDVEGKIEVTYKHKTKNSYTNEETFTRQIFREPINISYSVFTPGDVVTSLDVSVNNPNVRITNYPGPASGGTATGTIVVENITPPIVLEWHESTTIENECYYRNSYTSEELEKLITIPSNTTTDEYRLNQVPYSVVSIDNSNVSASIIETDGKHKLQVTTSYQEPWSTDNDLALADTTGKIIADFIEFNNDETEYKYFTQSQPKIISEKYPLVKQTLPTLDERRKKYTYFQDRAFLNKVADNPYVDVERWNLEILYPDGKPNTALYIDPLEIKINPDNSTSNIYDYFPVHLKNNSSPKVFVEIKGDAIGTNGTFRYDLYYRKSGTVPVGDSPINWQPITIETSNKMIRNGILAYWDVTGLNGEYELILRVNDSSGVVETKRKITCLFQNLRVNLIT